MTMLFADRQKNGETWHYVKSAQALEKFQGVDSHLRSSATLSGGQKQEIRNLLLPNFHVLIFIDGYMSEEFSSSIPDAKGVQQNLKISMETEGEFQIRSSYLSSEFLNLKSICGSQFHISVQPEALALKGLQIVFVSTQGEININPHVHVDIQGGAQIEIVQMDVCIGNTAGLNSRTAVKYFVGGGAHLNLTQIQVGTSALMMQSQFVLNENAKMEHLFFSLGGNWVRNECDIQLNGFGASLVTKGLSFTTGSQVIDHATLIDHKVGGATSKQLFKAIVSGESKSSFTGKVYINKGANKAYSEQLSRNLILTKKAEANSRPQLQVYADDVQATHGATFGQLNEEEIFYLCSRGISNFEARQLLTLGFAEEMISSESGAAQFLKSNLHEFYKTHFGY